jgi:hypothetical protein
MSGLPSITGHSKAEWITGAEARRIVKCNAGPLYRACVLGLIRVKLEPGQYPLYNREDCERHRGVGGNLSPARKPAAPKKAARAEGRPIGKGPGNGRPRRAAS